MYTLYFMPGACSLATQVILRELNQPVRLIDKSNTPDFAKINPVGSVPVLVDGEQQGDQAILREGVAIILHLLNKHENSLMPSGSVFRTQAVENLLYANATVHPAYGRLFFIAEHISDGPNKDAAFKAAADSINHLWGVVENKLAGQPYLGGDRVSPADILLAVYSRWGEYFPVDIRIGENTSRMINKVIQMDSFQRSLAAESTESNAA